MDKYLECSCGSKFPWSREGYSLAKEHLHEEMTHDMKLLLELSDEIFKKAFELYTIYYGNDTELV